MVFQSTVACSNDAGLTIELYLSSAVNTEIHISTLA
jgi:hypothetical protein